MPKPNLPPTPAASTEIPVKDQSSVTTTEKPFDLPSPAIAPRGSNENLKKRANASPTFTLPPPPTRSRTIIQMKPKPPSHVEPASNVSHLSGMKKKGPLGSQTSSKRQPSSTSAAGKKIARKTAHSVIERRRRSKMNEEFATLKSMIPACTDQEMHKLAILQASIDYLRYLERCILELKAANNSLSTPVMHPQVPSWRGDDDGEEVENVEDDEEEEPEEGGYEDTVMENAVLISPTHPTAVVAPSNTTSSDSATPSPFLDEQSSYQSSSFPSSFPALPSPVSSSLGHHLSPNCLGPSSSMSPLIVPNKQQDEEAMAALLMLNRDRRNLKGSRGMSVKDLLSS